jgi:uncharacterized protein (TIGR02099 family)
VHKTHKHLRILRRTLWYFLASLVVIVAVLVSLLRLFLPDLTAYRDDLEKLASTFMDHTVRIESMDARLIGITPTLIFNDVYMLDKSGERELVRFKQARLGLALIDSISQGRVVPSNFTIDGVSLAVTRHKDGRFSVQGVDLTEFEKTFNTERPKGSKGSGELADWLFRRSRLAIRNSTIIWQDLKLGSETLRFDDVNLVLRNSDPRHQLNGQVRLPERMGKSFDIALDVNGDILNPREMQGQIYMRGDTVQLDQWGIKPQYMDVSLTSGTADFEVWGKWENNAIASLSGDITAYDLSLDLPVMKEPYQVELLGGLFDVDHNADGWTLNVDRFQYVSADDIWPQTRFRIFHQRGNDTRPARWRVDTDYFRIEDVSGLLLKTNLLDTRLRQFLSVAKPKGEVRRLHFQHSQKSDSPAGYQLQTDFKNIVTQPWEKLPGLQDFDGELYASNRYGSLKLEAGHESKLEMPRLFRNPFNLEQLQARMRWVADDHHWQIWSEQLQVDTDDVQVNANMMLDMPRDRNVSPYLDLQARFKNGRVEHAERYYPVGIMKPKLVDWLDHSIVSGHVTEGGVVYNGRLQKLPFRNNQGQFQVAFDAKDVLLDYREGWPAIDGIDLSAVFTGKGMEIMTRKGQLFDTRLSPSRAVITDFKNPQLELQVDANGNLVDVARFLVESPVASGGRHFVKQTRIDGSAHTRFSAMIPLNKRMQQQAPGHYQGKVTIDKGALHMLDDRLAITGVNGEIDFDQEGVRSKVLQARLQDREMEMQLETRRSQSGDKQISILANGELDAERLADRFAPQLSGRLSGTGSWHGAVVFDTGQSSRAPLVRIDSTLEGVSSTLPSPLAKQAEEPLRLLTEVRFPGQKQTRIRVNLGDKLITRLQLEHDNGNSRLERGIVHFGSGAVPLPDKPELQITGSLDQFNAGQWRQLARKEQQQDKLSLPMLPIRVNMQRLVMVKDETSGTQTPDRQVKHPPPPELPSIKGIIEHFQYAGHRLGRLEFNLRTLKKGIRLQRLALQGDNMELHASGSWLYERRRHSSNLKYELTSPNTGQLMDSLGYSAIINGGELQTRGELSWNAPPAAFEIGMLDGDIDLLVEKGSIVKVKPGAGRLLGLFSLSALPRRLTLDFRDTFREGFSFDRMQGKMKIRDGDAYSDDMQIVSPVAEIKIKGRTGLAAQDFDQLVTVTPQVSDTLPLAGGLLFGTQVGAAVLFLEKLVGGGIDKASEKRYHITGSWEEPVITALDTQKQPDKSSPSPAQNPAPQVPTNTQGDSAGD